MILGSGLACQHQNLLAAAVDVQLTRADYGSQFWAQRIYATFWHIKKKNTQLYIFGCKTGCKSRKSLIIK